MTTKAVGTPRNISDESRLKKNKRISQTMRKTKERRRNMICKTFDLKIQSNKLSASQKEALFRLFLEAKWIRNDCLAHGIDDYVLGSTAQVKVGDDVEVRNLTVIGSQMKQSVVSQLKDDRKALAASKKRGRKVGALKFVSEVNSIDLKQYETTYKLHGKNKMKIQNIPKYVKVLGVDQIPANAEFANAKLLNKPDGYHIKVTVYITPDDLVDDGYVEEGTFIGVDMGIKDAFVFSDGSMANAVVEESDHLKRLHKKLSRQQKGSKNYRRTVSLIKKEYSKLSNKKDDIANKLVHDLLSQEIVFIQDENIKAWKTKKSKARGSKKVQHGILGRVKAKLIENNRVIVLDRYEATTRTCTCGFKFEEGLDLGIREFSCPKCGRQLDRDVHAAQMMIVLGKEEINKNTPVGRRLARVESMSDLATKDYRSFVSKQWAMKHEAPLL